MENNNTTNKQAIKILEQAIVYHKEQYYNNVAEISDDEFDKLEDQLRELDPNNVVLNKVGAPVSKSNKHSIPMASIQKFNNVDDLKKWIGNKSVTYSYKLDGSSMSLVYNNKQFSQALTRGDGEYGEDKTEFFNHINVPKITNMANVDNFVVWGEVVISNENFIKLQNEMIALGLEPVSSQRNAVAGILNRKSDKQLSKYFDFLAHNIFWENCELTHTDKFIVLSSKYFGFKTPYYNVIQDLWNIIDVYTHKNYDYLTDGIVITENKQHYDFNDRTSRHYKWNACYKFSSDVAETVVKNIQYNTGRTGKVTPLIEIETVYLSGANISNCTGNNVKFIKDNGICAGTRLTITRSNEIIPKIVNVIGDKVEYESVYDVVKYCSSCGGELVINSTCTDMFCHNSTCPAQNLKSIVNFAKTMEIDGLSTKTIEKFLEYGIIVNYFDIYRLNVDDILEIDGFKEKSANNIINNIKSSITNNKITLSKCIESFGLPNIGKDVSNKIAERFGVEQDYNKTTLSNINGFGDVIVESLLWNQQEIKDGIKKLQDIGFNFNVKENNITTSNINLKLSNLNFILSGSFSKVKKEIEQLIVDNGGKIVSSVNKELDYLISNEIGTSKYNKALQLGKKVISEEQLMQMIG